MWRSIVLAIGLSLAIDGTMQAEPIANQGGGAEAAAADKPAESRPSLVLSVTIFALAILLGVELIGKVPATLHTPLMSGSNAISGITVVGALIAAGAVGRVGPPIAFLAIALAMINVVGGFLVTHRMLQMFKRK